MQAVFGTRSENLKTDMEEYMRAGGAATIPAPAPPLPPAVEPSDEVEPVVGPEDRALAAALIAALGGAENIARAERCALTRVRVELRDGRTVDASALEAAGALGVLRVSDSAAHVLLGERATATAAALDDELRAPASRQ